MGSSNSFCFCRSSCAPVSFVSSCLTTFQVPSGTRTMPIRFSFPLGVECPHMGAFCTRSSKAERCCCVCMPGQAPANALSRSFVVIDSCTNFWALSQSRILFSLFDTLLGFVRQYWMPFCSSFSCLTVFQASSGTTCVPIRFFLFLWAWRGDGSASVAEFVGQGKHWRTFGVLFFLSLRFVQFRIFLFDDLLGTVKLQSSALFVCGFLWVLSAHLRCDSHHSRQRTVFVSVARTNPLSSVPCWAVLNPSSGGTHVTPLAPP